MSGRLALTIISDDPPVRGDECVLAEGGVRRQKGVVVVVFVDVFRRMCHTVVLLPFSARPLLLSLGFPHPF